MESTVTTFRRLSRRSESLYMRSFPIIGRRMCWDTTGSRLSSRSGTCRCSFRRGRWVNFDGRRLPPVPQQIEHVCIACVSHPRPTLAPSAFPNATHERGDVSSSRILPRRHVPLVSSVEKKLPWWTHPFPFRIHSRTRGSSFRNRTRSRDASVSTEERKENTIRVSGTDPSGTSDAYPYGTDEVDDGCLVPQRTGDLVGFWREIGGFLVGLRRAGLVASEAMAHERSIRVARAHVRVLTSASLPHAMAAVMTRLSRVDVETQGGRCASGELVDGVADDELLPVDEDACSTGKRKCVLDVPHLRQSYTWDCGLACCLMVLKALNATDADLKLLRKMCRTTSVWTVDLAHLLNNFGLEVYFYTITLGANPEFFSENFYKDNMEEDRGRVETLFHLASEQGIRVRRRSVSGREMRRIVLSGEYVVIALVDKSKLNPPWVTLAAESCLPAYCYGLVGGYTGHYIVVCGYNADRQEYLVRDPASSHALVHVQEEAFEKARKSFGTDEDLLFISTKVSRGTPLKKRYVSATTFVAGQLREQEDTEE